MRIALLSDVHGNEVALRAVLADIERRGADRVVCLGDVATLGPRPREVLALLRALGCDCVLGNHDAFLLDPGLVRSYTEAPFLVAAIDWCRAQLTDDDLAFVRSFAATVEAPGKMLFFHGSPRSHMTDILAETPVETLDTMLAGTDAGVLAGGHTHVQMLRQHRGRLLVNPGSVGLPFREYVGGGPPTLMPDHAEYAVVEAEGSDVSVTLRRVPVDRRALREAVSGSDNPFGPMLLAQYG